MQVESDPATQAWRHLNASRHGAIRSGVVRIRAALKGRTHERVPLDWAMTQTNLGIALALIGERTRDLTVLREAREAISGAFAVYMEAGQEHRRPRFEAKLRAIDRIIDELGGGVAGGDGRG